MIETIHEDVKADIERSVNDVTIGMIATAKKAQRYYDILKEVGLPETIIIACIREWHHADSRIEVESFLHRIFAEQHAAMDAAKEGTD